MDGGGCLILDKLSSSDIFLNEVNAAAGDKLIVAV